MTRQALWLFLLLWFLPMSARTAEPELRGEYQKWLVYKYQEPGGLICYAMTRAEETNDIKGKHVKIKSRGQVLLQITHRVAEGNNLVISYVAGQTIKTKTPVTLQTDKKKFRLRGDGDTAWTESTAIDADLVKAIRGSKFLTVTHQDRKGVAVTDIFSLKGAGNALAVVEKCD